MLTITRAEKHVGNYIGSSKEFVLGKVRILNDLYRQNI